MRLLSAVVPLLLAACATPAAAPQRWSGVYDFQFETSSFAPDGSNERWWVTPANPRAQQQLRAALRAPPNGPPWGRASVTIEGGLSAPGRYGHLGAYDRQVAVTRVISSGPAPRT